MRDGPLRWVAAMGLTLALSGCAARRGRQVEPMPTPELELSSLAATFAGADEGRFDISLTVHQPAWSGAKAIGMAWEAWIDKRLFASGRVALRELTVDGSGATPLALSLPVIYRHLEYRPGPTRIQLRFRGTLELQRGPVTWSREFERTQSLTSDGAPIPPGGLDAER